MKKKLNNVLWSDFVNIISNQSLGLVDVEDRTDLEHVLFEYIKDCSKIVITDGMGGELRIKFKGC